MPSSKSSKSERRSRQKDEDAVKETAAARGLPSGRSSYASSRASASRRSDSGGLTHEDEIERIREMRARRLAQERGDSGGQEEHRAAAVSASESLRQRRADLSSMQRRSDDSGENNPSRVRSSPALSRRELEDAGLVRKDRRSSRSSSSATDLDYADDATSASSYARARRERLERARAQGSSEVEILELSSDPRATTRLDIEARMAARRNNRKALDAVGSTTQMSLDEMRKRREGSNRSVRSPRSDVDSDEMHSDEDETRSSARERIKERAKRSIPRRSKSADEDLMMTRTSSHSLLGSPGKAGKNQNDADSLEERETRRLERLNRSAETTSIDLSTRLEERRKARAAEREAREREKIVESSDITNLRLRNRLSTTERRGQGNMNISIQDLEITDDETEDESLSSWSVRLCLVSAMDLPLNVVPNTPLCPLLKLGLVKLPNDPSMESEEMATRTVMNALGDRSVEAVRSAQICTTTHKILGKRDNGTVDFHQEYRWDGVKQPANVGLCVELSARAARIPTNYLESPPALSQRSAYAVQESSTTAARAHEQLSTSNLDPVRGVNRTPSGSEDSSGFRSFWNKGNKKQAELEAAEAAAAVARMLVEDEGGGTNSSSGSNNKTSTTPQSDYDVSLRTEKAAQSTGRMTEELKLGSLVIPLAKLSLEKATATNEAVRLEQWYQLEPTDDAVGESQRRKKPSVLLEISFSAPEVLDESEDELEEDELPDEENQDAMAERLNASFARRSTRQLLVEQTKDQEKPKEEAKNEDPFLDPGVIDFVAVVGCRDIGKQKHDDGSKGWVKSTPESVVMEQFPPESDYHVKMGRNVLLPEMVQWFCFPEGAKLWRGTNPPSHSDLNLRRFSAASPPNVASSVAAFDACLNCTTSFSWFVIASNSDEYGSSLVKTYGAVIRFYVPAPSGVDPTQDDFAQALLGNVTKSAASGLVKRLWVPMGICMTSNMPLVGVMEALLLRLCEELSAISGCLDSSKLEGIHKAVANMILNFQKPIAGAVNCSVPFLLGDRFLISLPPPSGLPPLPHGRSVISVCRLLGAEGLNYVISAVLTECKVLFHSQEIADITMVAEVITALTYPFAWSLPYIPILPPGMLEFVEAPLSYILGTPSCNLEQLDPRALDDVVVIDLNNGFSSMDHNQSRRQSKHMANKHPTPLPASVATNLSKALYRLLRLEEEMEEEFGSADFGEHVLPRLESESLAEREFRVTVAIEICGLLRGYQDCVGTVFNRDKFLKTAPALYEERRESKGVGGGLGSRNVASGQNRVLSARSKRFLSLLVNGQNFQQLLESLESPEVSLFHEIMELIDNSSNDTKPHIAIRATSNDSGHNQAERNIQHLMKSLQQKEDKIPTYMVEKGGGLDGGHYDDSDFDYDFDDFDDFDVGGEFISSEVRRVTSFTSNILSPIPSESGIVESSEPGKQSLSMEYLAKLETTPWDYQELFKIPVGSNEADGSLVDINEKVKLRDAIGERRFRAWKMSQAQRPGADADLAFLPESARAAAKHGAALNLTSLVTSAKNDKSDTSSLSSGRSNLRASALSAEKQKVADAKSRDIIRRCMDKAQSSEGSQADQTELFKEKRRNLMVEAEKALRNPSAQLFLLQILAQRSRLESQGSRTVRRQSVVANSASRLDPVAFNCLVRLSCAMLDSCMEYKEFEPAYRLLTNTAGFIMVLESDKDQLEDGEGHNRIVVTMTTRVGLHPIFADLGVWETVMKLHLRDRQSAKKFEGARLGQDEESGDEDADEIEYEAAVATLYEMVGYGIPGEELSRFAMRASEENGWFCDDRGRQLLMLARRISVRRDQADTGGTGEASDIGMVRKGPEKLDATASSNESVLEESQEYFWKECGWCHPAAPSSRVLSGRSVKNDSNHSRSAEDLLKRSAVTSLASFGTSLVVSGGIDGGVFLAHSINDGFRITEDNKNPQAAPEVRGIHLDWGSASRAGTGTSSDGEYGVGAVSCLAAAYGGGHHSHNVAPTKNIGGESSESDFVDSMEGSKIVAGTTAGDLRVWSVKDIYSAILMAQNDPSSASASTRLKVSLRGRALSGHRGGVTCIDVPSQVYRPDSLVTGGADGLIKLWSLRAPSSSRRNATDVEAGGTNSSQQRGRGGDALSTLSDHVGRILCIQTAWHGDHLLSGGADRTIRVWDLASGGGKSIHTLHGHFGWVTKVQYWGPNTIVSASTDRSVALWDARVRSSPLFLLRHHLSPVSDLLVGSRTDPFMVSSGTDGSIAAWDFRMLAETDINYASNKKEVSRSCTVIREPTISMFHNPACAGPTLLARSVKNPMNSFLSVGSDAILREWDYASGGMQEESPTGHCDVISSFESFAVNSGFGSTSTSGAASLIDNSDSPVHKGTLTSSLDGTIRMRRRIRKSRD